MSIDKSQISGLVLQATRMLTNPEDAQNHQNDETQSEGQRSDELNMIHNAESYLPLCMSSRRPDTFVLQR